MENRDKLVTYIEFKLNNIYEKSSEEVIDNLERLLEEEVKKSAG